MDSGSEVSQFLDELNVKAMESVYNLVQDEHRGLISREAVKQGVRAVFEATSGYLAPKTYEAISIVSEQYKDAVGYTVRKSKAQDRIYIHVHGKGKLFATTVSQVRPISAPRYNDIELDADEAIRRKFTGNK